MAFVRASRAEAGTTVEGAMIADAVVAETEAGSGPGISNTRCCGGLGLGVSSRRLESEAGDPEEVRRRGSDAMLGVAHERGAGEIELNLQLASH